MINIKDNSLKKTIYKKNRKIQQQQQQQIQKMEQSQKAQLKNKLKQLAAKRQKHQGIISNLLQNKQNSINQSSLPSRSSTLRIDGYMDKQWNRNEEEVNGINTNRSNISCLSSLSRQVNLETYLADKPQKSGGDRTQIFGQNKLQSSLKSAYGQVEFLIWPCPAMISGSSIISDDFIDFEIIARYLQKNELWNQVFIKKNQGYYACICQEFNSHHIHFINLSKQKLQHKEMKLVIECTHPQNNKLANTNPVQIKKQKKQVCIGYLLLYRLMSYLGTGYAPEIIQNLFGYPYKCYNIHNTIQYIEFKNIFFLYQSMSINVMVLGQNAMDQRLELIQGCYSENNRQLQFNKYLSIYNKLIIIYLKQGLCCKSIDITHRRNHHSVIDLQNNDDKQIKIYLSFVSHKISGKKKQGKFISNFSSKSSISNEFCEQHSIQSTMYRFCLMNEGGDIVKFSSPFQMNREAVQLKLSANSEYKLYISEICQKIKDVDDELCQFSVNIHSSNSLQNIVTQIKFNENYNILTYTIINKYLKDFSNIDQIQKQMIKLSETNPSSDLLIIRTHLKIMGLNTDFISVRQHVRKMGKNIYIEYQDKEVLCDQYYRDNRKKLTIAQPQIYQIFLSKNSPLKSCSGFTYSLAQIFL